MFQVLGAVVDGVIPLDSETSALLQDTLTILCCKVTTAKAATWCKSGKFAVFCLARLGIALVLHWILYSRKLFFVTCE